MCVCCVCVYVETRTEPSQIEELQATQRNELPASASTMHSPVSLRDILSNCVSTPLCTFSRILFLISAWYIVAWFIETVLPSLETSHSRKSDE